MKGWKIYAMPMETKSRAGILISEKINFNPQTVIHDKEDHYKMIKGSIHQEDITQRIA